MKLQTAAHPLSGFLYAVTCVLVSKGVRNSVLFVPVWLFAAAGI